MLNLAPFLLLFSAQAAGEATMVPVLGSDEPANTEQLHGASFSEEPKPPPQASTLPCRTSTPTGADEIVVCAERSEGYRINPDILKAQRQVRNRIKPKPPERMVDTSCKTVGPMGCMAAPTINIISAAATAAAIVKKAVNGENVGKMFVTQPELSEYELYLVAKREREEKEAQAEAGASGETKATDPPL